jgi:hypothetical protein
MVSNMCMVLNWTTIGELSANQNQTQDPLLPHHLVERISISSLQSGSVKLAILGKSPDLLAWSLTFAQPLQESSVLAKRWFEKETLGKMGDSSNRPFQSKYAFP